MSDPLKAATERLEGVVAALEGDGEITPDALAALAQQALDASEAVLQAMSAAVERPLPTPPSH